MVIDEAVGDEKNGSWNNRTSRQVVHSWPQQFGSLKEKKFTVLNMAFIEGHLTYVKYIKLGMLRRITSTH